MIILRKLDAIMIKVQKDMIARITFSALLSLKKLMQHRTITRFSRLTASS